MKWIPYKPNELKPIPKPEKKEKKTYKINKISEKAKSKKDEKREQAIKLEAVCKEFYNSHPTKRCYECNERILVPTKMSYHHLLPKKFQDKYDTDITFNPDNLVLLCFKDHSKCETNIDFAPRTKELTAYTYQQFEKYLK